MSTKKHSPAIQEVKNHEGEGLWHPYKTPPPSFGFSPLTLLPTSLYHPTKRSQIKLIINTDIILKA